MYVSTFYVLITLLECLLPFLGIYYTCLEPYRSLVMNRLMSTRIVPKMRRLCGETEVIWFFNVAYVRRVSPVLRWFQRHMTPYKGATINYGAAW